MRWKILLSVAALATLGHAIQKPATTNKNRNSQVAVNSPSELNQATHAPNLEDATTEKSVFQESETESDIVSSRSDQNSDVTDSGSESTRASSSSSSSNILNSGEKVTEESIFDSGNIDNSGSQYNTTNSQDNASDEQKDNSEDKSEFGGSHGSIDRSLDVSSGDSMKVENETPDDNEEYIQTTYGPVKGFLWAGSDHIKSYIDIPYGSFNRFETPSEPDSWETVHEIIEHNKRCPQLVGDTYVGDHDCLTLSVFSPIDARNASVLFHIYDSKFIKGSADPMIYGPKHLVSKGIILVLPNYRVGPLGFLCLQNETAFGNAALKDLSLALNWVHRNIVNFGGNPDNIIVSGDGTSGALVGYLSVSSNSSRYINKAITESGSVLSHWAVDRDPFDTVSQFLEAIKDHGSLETIDIPTIYTILRNITFRPCIGLSSEAFVDGTPWSMIRDNEINITFMIGSANYAGAHKALEQSQEIISNLNEHFEMLLPNDLHFQNSELRTEIAARVRSEYFGNQSISLERLEEISLYFTDASYLGPSLRSARLLVESGATVFLYEFGFVGALNRELIAIESPVQGAVMGDLMGYIFAFDEMTLVEDSAETRIVALLLDLWISFINTGKPNADAISWNELKLGEYSEEPWLTINNATMIQNGLHETRMKLWTEIYDSYFIERNLASKQTFCHTLALMAPKPPPYWSGIFEATYKIRCPQDGVMGDENCLVVNVFTPTDPAACPVVVHIHDGDFQTGWGSHKPPTRLIQEDFIVVTFNYRIGALGFLCLGTPEAPGNAGLKDQVSALYWVQRNIRYFGGDPYDVTVYGSGAGAASIELLLLSGLTNGLVHRVIMESGSALSPSSLTYDPVSIAFEVAKKIGYDDVLQVSELGKFYKKATVSKLRDTKAMFLPCIENNLGYANGLIDSDPIIILETGDFQKVPMIITYTNIAGLLAEKYKNQLNTVPDRFDMLLPSNLEFDNVDIRHKVGQLTKEFYFEVNLHGETNIVETYENYMYDIFNEYPSVKSAILHAISNQFESIYLMKFVYRSDPNRMDRNMVGDGFMSIFDFIFSERYLNGNDELTANRLVTIWSNFIKYNDPTPITTNVIPIIWTPVMLQLSPDISKVPELVFNTSLNMGEPSHQRLQFWERVYSKFYRRHGPEA